LPEGSWEGGRNWAGAATRHERRLPRTIKRAKLFTFRYSATLGGFDDSPLLQFVRDKEVLSFREHFFEVNDTPHLACVVTYQDAVVPAEALEAARVMKAVMPTAAPASAAFHSNGAPRHGGWRGANGDRADPAAGLGEPERALFNTLREWRARKAREEGVPPYLLLTNRQLLEVVVKRPESPTALGHLPGVGPGKVERYGREILSCLRGAPAAMPASAATSCAAATSAIATSAAASMPTALVSAPPATLETPAAAAATAPISGEPAAVAS
jgi:HRDC domain-containing protein